MSDLLNSITTALSIEIDGYKFAKYPFGEQGTFLSHDLIFDIKRGLIGLIGTQKPDFIICSEPGSHTWGLLLAAEIQTSLNIVRCRKFAKKTNEKIYKQKNGYCERGLLFENLIPGSSAIIFEDVISTGNTVKVIIETLQEHKINIISVLSILRKGNDNLEMLYNYPIKSLIKI